MVALLTAFLCSSASASDDWLSWPATDAEAVGKAERIPPSIRTRRPA